MWTDQHCHLPTGPDGDALVREANESGVTRLITVGTSLTSSRDAIAVAQRHRDVWATAGVHPHDASDGIDGIVDLLVAPKVVAVGECGLDYHYLHSPAETQRDAFAAQISLAHETGLALVIHTREAWDDTFDLLSALGTPERTVFHCFTGGPIEARRCLDLGAVLSFSGIVTFPSASELREAARLCPEDRYVVETDTPYLAPVPHRGRPNRPSLVAVIGAAMAEVRGVALEVVAAQTWGTASRLYGLAGSAA
jgi:TatD DNase family protein